jgi:hypothetical protein
VDPMMDPPRVDPKLDYEEIGDDPDKDQDR